MKSRETGSFLQARFRLSPSPDFGVLGVPVHPVSAVRIAGAALLVVGVVLIHM